jgi:hypothetical protein
MAHWTGERYKSCLMLEQEEFDRLPNCIKEANRGSLLFPYQDYPLALFGLPYLLTQYDVVGYIDHGETGEAHSVTYKFSELFGLIREQRPLIYKQVMEERYPWKPYPQAGDVVRLTAEWPWAGSLVKVGTYGVIEGCVGEKYDDLGVTWNYSAHRGWSCCGSPMVDLRSKHFLALEKEWKEYVSCSGGPATIALPTKLLRPTDETELIR